MKTKAARIVARRIISETSKKGVTCMKTLGKSLLVLSLLVALGWISPALATLPAPGLSISLTGPNQVLLSWQDTNDWLQSVPSLNSPFLPFLWTNVGATPANSMTLPTAQAMQFFRLVASPGRRRQRNFPWRTGATPMAITIWN